uniref:Candidate secreted effector n=1 Tax=Meloidogyne incognita TaxID=6306 RepID=A0A914MK89_MELIC
MITVVVVESELFLQFHYQEDLKEMMLAQPEVQILMGKCRCWCRSRWWWRCIKNTSQCWLYNWRSNGLWRTKNVTNQSRC